MRMLSRNKSSAGAVRSMLICRVFLVLWSILLGSLAYADGWLPGTSTVGGDTTSALNEIRNKEISSDGLRVGGIANTRHNLTMTYNTNFTRMDDYRNNYFEICVYCHTPHAANSTAAAPLWNRTVAQRTYTLYNEAATAPTTLDLNYTQPGPNSLTCLSCHDGATAIDSIINMPTQMTGEFRAGYKNEQETQVNSAFLDAWSGNNLALDGKPAGSPADTGAAGHAGFNTTEGSYCLSCHAPSPGGIAGLGPDFRVFSIGDNFVTGEKSGGYLADDHPVGVRYPQEFGADVDYREPDVKAPKIAFFDSNGNSHADPNEVRLYDTGDGYEVECGSCHDPHGIKVSNANRNELIPSFLRVGVINPDVSNADSSTTGRKLVSANNGSALCLTCHVK